MPENSAGLLGVTVVSLVALTGLFGTPALNAQDEEVWPREIETEKGLVILYQPQVDSLEGNDLRARTAVGVIPEGKTEPVFGAAWLQARIATDFESRTVYLEGIRVPQVRFPESTPELQQGLIDLLTDEIPKWNLEIALDDLSALLDLADKQSQIAEGFDDRPPKIRIVDYPSVLVTIDGAPRLRRLEDSDDLQYVVNSPFLIVHFPSKKTYYLYGGAGSWYQATAVEGPWEYTKKVPKKVRKLEPEDEEVEASDAAKSGLDPPSVIVTTEPMELIVTDGPPEYEPISDGELLVVNNTESDVLREVATQRIFVLLSGRWFASDSTDGPWEYVAADTLPSGFAQIDPDSDYGHLLTWVAGTELANEVVLDSYIPQTAAIKRTATIEVTYDGAPEFEPIEETTLQYATNTEYQVIQAGNEYFCAYEGVWYSADSPTGPWRVAVEVPDEIRKIPASSSVYNTKYIYVFDSDPEVVYVGYYPGYVHSYDYNGCVVYGTGWYYSPWWSPRGYYPRHSTWGFHVRWNPWSGWGFGFSYSTGRWTFGIGYGGWYRGGWWGPRGYRGYRRGYNRGWSQGYRSGRRSGYNAGYRSAKRDTGRNIYQNRGNASRVAGTAAATGRPTSASSRANNVYADAGGNVHRQSADGNWQSRQDGKWQGGQSAGGAASAGGDRTSLNNAAQARSRGNQRTQSHRSSRGGRRGSGGRRR